MVFRASYKRQSFRRLLNEGEENIMLIPILIIISNILLIFLGIFIVSRFQTWFAKQRLKIISIFIILGICIYSVGYLTKSQGALDYISSGLMAIFSTGRMFVFENDISSFESNVIPMYRMFFGLIMTSSMLATGMIILSLLGYRVMSKLQINFVRHFVHKRKVYIFTDLNENSLNLANDIKRNNKKDIVILCVDGASNSEECTRYEKEASAAHHLIYTSYDAKDRINLCFRFKKSRTFIFAIHENIYDNIFLLEQYAQRYQTNKKKNWDVSMYVFSDYDFCEDIFYTENIYPFDLHIIDTKDLISRQLFHQFTLISTLGNSNVLTVCVIGFSEICEHLYRNIIYLGQFDGIQLKLLLIDQDIRDKTAVFFQTNSEIEKCVEVTYVDVKVATEEYYKELKKHLPDINCIIVAEDDRKTVSEIRRLCKHSKAKTKVCAYGKDYEKYQVLLKTNMLSDVIWFGSSKELFTENCIINEAFDLIAKQCNNYYNRIYHSTRTWEEISLFEKQSNRALALHFQSKLNYIGLRYEKSGNITVYEERLKDDNIFEQLSKGEHMRWNAYHFVNGWRTMTDFHSAQHKDGILKLHSCLVPWDELDQLSSVFHKDFKKSDESLIQNLGLILSSVGYGITNYER